MCVSSDIPMSAAPLNPQHTNYLVGTASPASGLNSLGGCCCCRGGAASTSGAAEREAAAAVAADIGVSELLPLLLLSSPLL